MWELGQESHLPEFKGDADYSGLQPSFLHSIDVVSPILHPVWSIWNTNMTCLSFLELINVSSSLTKLKLCIIKYKASHGLPTSPCSCLVLILYTLTIQTTVVFHGPQCFFLPPHHSLYYYLCLKGPSVLSLLGWLGFLFSYSGSALIVILKAFWPTSLVNCPSLFPHHCPCLCNNAHYFVLKLLLWIFFPTIFEDTGIISYSVLHLYL